MRQDPVSEMASLWRKSQGEYFCVAVKSTTGKLKDHFFKRREIPKAVEFAKKMMKTHNVYMCPHGLSKPRRIKENTIPPNLFFADLDEINPKELAVKPTVLIESSPDRYVGYWLTDAPVPEELNRRLTYMLGSDVSGWDHTQLLRVPGTLNHKYPEKPRVKVVWKDGPRYQINRMERMLPQVEDDKGKSDGGEAAEIYAEYEKHLPRDTRKELTNPIVKEGKRSEVLWKLINDCVEVGMTGEEIFTLLWDNPWNKFNERRGGERMLERQIEKATGRHVAGDKKPPKKRKTVLKSSSSDQSEEKRFHLVTMDKVKEEKVDWLVYGMIARGELTMFEGDPGVGKSYFLMWLAVHFCDGKKLDWEDECLYDRPLRVLYLDMENSKATVTRVRLTDNGLVHDENYAQLDEPFAFTDPDSLEQFEEEVISVFQPDVVIVDPVTLYLGGTDTHKAAETQTALQTFRQMAARNGFAGIMVRHLNKNNAGSKAIYAGNGSIAFAGTARIVASIGWHPEESGVRVVACTKNNLSQFFGSLEYSIEAVAGKLGDKNRSKLEYLGRSDLMAEDIIGTSTPKNDNSLDVAKGLLMEEIEKGKDVNYHNLLNIGDTRSISERSIRQAMTELGYRKEIRGRGKNRHTFIVKAS